MSTPRPRRKVAQKVDYKEVDPESLDSMLIASQSSEPSTLNGLSQSSESASTSRRSRSKNVMSSSVVSPVPMPEPEKFPVILNVSDAKFTDDTRTAAIFSDGTTIAKNDMVFMVSEPPGEPYFIARVMGFEPRPNARSKDSVEGHELRVNWFYRPRDILKKNIDSRLVYATMHSDKCPIATYRGHVTVRHRLEIDNLQEYRQQPKSFYFDKLFDRYMIKSYDILPTALLQELPENYRTALAKRFAYVFVETGSGSDLLVSPKSCVKCGQWCSVSDSVECAHCHEWYHMACLSPPLTKKPSRGYSWGCARCTSGITGIKAVANHVEPVVPAFERKAAEFLESDKNLTIEQRRAVEEWPYRYLGIHARLEDALDLEDRPYPRNSSRLGPKNQAVIPDWNGHYEVYYDIEQKNESPAPASRKGNKRRRKNPSISSGSQEAFQKRLELPEEFAGIPTEQLPAWVKPRPKGYVERGLDDGTSSTLMWKQPTGSKELENKIDNFVFRKLGPIAKDLTVPGISSMSRIQINFLDAAFKALLDNQLDFEKTYQQVKTFTRESLREPTFSDAEIDKFEKAVAEYGSELLPVSRAVNTQPFAMIVRFYYIWKKTPRGHAIWDNFPGRRRKRAKAITSKADPLADPDDDSGYDIGASSRLHVRFTCAHCNTHDCKRWHRAPNVITAEGQLEITALCARCARLWRCYAIKWESPAEILRKAKGAGRKKMEIELIKEAKLVKELEESKRRDEKAKSVTPKEEVVVEEITVSDGEKNSTSAEPEKSEKEKEEEEKLRARREKQRIRQRERRERQRKAREAEIVRELQEKVDKAKPKGDKKQKNENIEEENRVEGKKEIATPTKKNASKERVKKSAKKEPVKKEEKEEPIGGDSIVIDTHEKVNGKIEAIDVDNEAENKPQTVKYLQQKPADVQSRNRSARKPLKANTNKVILDQVNPNYSYDFQNFDPLLREFDNPLPEPKEDLTIPLSPKLKSSNSRDSPGLKHIITVNGLFSPHNRPCCVCRSNNEEDINEVIICSNCGLNVHATCYGIPKIEGAKMYTREWCCDPCSNDLHPICSTYYGCCLCYSKEVDHDSAIIGAPCAYPDALKRTSDFRWVHILCALFSKSVCFEDSKTFQGAVKVPVSLVRHEMSFCFICGIKSGSLTQCACCKSQAHITCCIDAVPELFYGFKISSDYNYEEKRLVKIVKDGTIGVPEPIILCPEHNGESENYYTMREPAMNLKGTESGPLMKVYAEKFMQWDQNVKGPALRYLEQRMVEDELQRKVLKKDIKTDPKRWEMNNGIVSIKAENYGGLICKKKWWENKV